MSLFYGDFMRLVVQLNEDANWRRILGSPPDQRQKDVEIILRMFALTEGYQDFKKPLTKFINEYCRKMKKYSDEDGLYQRCFSNFSEHMAKLERDLYLEPKSKRVSVPILEACFAASAFQAFKDNDVNSIRSFDKNYVESLRNEGRFDELFTGKTTDVDSVKGRIALAVI